MIIVDWGNYEETLIVLRTVGEWEQRDFQRALLKIQQMQSFTSDDVDLMVDMRFSENISVMMLHLLNKIIESSNTRLHSIIVISTPIQNRMLMLAESFYPSFFREAQIVDSVDHAYEYLNAIA